MKKKLLAGLATGLMMFGVVGMASATTQTFDFEGGGAGTQSTEGFSIYGFGNKYLWSSGSTVNQGFNQSNGSTIDLSFNLAVIDSWDGNDPNLWWASPALYPQIS